MSVVNVRNSDVYSDLIGYDTESGAVTAVAPDAMPCGFFKRIDADIIWGVVKTDDMHRIFNNAHSYDFSAVQTRRTELSDTLAKLEIIKDGSVVDSVEYARPEFVDFDPWSSEEDQDIFANLANAI